MNKHKSSVIFLKDWEILIKSLSKENQLIFWDLFINYEPNSYNICEVEAVNPVWNFIKKQLDNMNENYQNKIVNRNKENGSKGGRPKKYIENQQHNKNPKNPMGYLETQKTLNENINENINVNENENKKENIKFDFKKNLIDFGFDLKLVDDWMKIRKTKKAINTETSFKGFIREIEKCKQDKNEILTLVVERSWVSFNQSWLNNVKQNENKSNTTTIYKNTKVNY